MKKILGACISAACALGAMAPEVRAQGGGQNGVYEGLPEKFMRDLRIRITYRANSGYLPVNGGSDPEEARWQFERSARMAFAMWQSLLPSLHVTWVENPEDANLELHVGNFKGADAAKRDLPFPEDCGAFGQNNWSGCSFSPGNWKAYELNVIYFDTFGSPQYGFSDFDYISRDRVWKGYQPAANPPRGYIKPGLPGANPGYLQGWFDLWQESPGIGSDGTSLVFHEFGHTLGMGHLRAGGKLKDFYGVPHPPNVAPGAQPNLIQVTSTALPGLPPEYYYNPAAGQAGYYGGGTVASPWVGDLKYGVIPVCWMLSTWDEGPIHPGLLGSPVYELWNSRVIHPDAGAFFKDQVPSYGQMMQYPKARALVRLHKPTTGGVQLTSNWTKATNLAQLDVPTQNDPWFVTSVHNHGQIRRLAAGGAHGLAIRFNGTLWAWGRNDKGQLGDGGTANTSTPKRIGTATNWVSVAAGADFSLGLREDGTLWAWGARAYGQIGDGSITGNQTTPKQVPGGPFASMAAGKYHALALKADGSLWAWGLNGNDQLGYNTLLATGKTYSAVPVPVYNEGIQWVAVNAGYYVSQALDVNGRLYSWGFNNEGTVGNGTWSRQDRPVREYLGKSDWVRTAGGYMHSAAVDGQGRLYTWGFNAQGQLGVNPSTLPGSNRPDWNVDHAWVTIAAGQDYTAGILKDGRLFAWGSNSAGQLGTSTDLGGIHPDPIQEVSFGSDWVDVQPGSDFALAMREDGTVWGWGSNTYGQLGTGGTKTSQPVPAPSLWYHYAPRNMKVTVPLGKDYAAPATVKVGLLFDGPATKVEFFRKLGGTTTLIGTRTSAPYEVVWNNAAYGKHYVWAVAHDGLGGSQSSKSDSVFVHTLSVTTTMVSTATNYRLSDEGTWDWAHYGYSLSQPENRKSTSTPLIAKLDEMRWEPGMMPAPAAGSIFGFTWSGGVPLAGLTTATRNGMMAAVTASPDMHGPKFVIGGMGTTQRVIRFYADVTNVRMALKVSMNGASASSPESTANGARIYTVTVRSLKPDLNSIYVMLTGAPTGNGKISLQAITVR